MPLRANLTSSASSLPLELQMKMFFHQRLPLLSGMFLLAFCLHGVEASGGNQIIHRKVGGSVELSSNQPTEGVSRATWKYFGFQVAAQGSGVAAANNPFQGRVEFNNQDFSLTVRELTLQDSGDFTFRSEAKGQQKPKVIITLQVHEPASTPSVSYSITKPDLSGVCAVTLDCRAAPYSNISYIWTVKSRTYNGSRLQHTITTQDGDTAFTCTASNVVSERSAFRSVRCSNDTSAPFYTASGFPPFMFWFRLVLGALVMLVMLWLLYSTNSKELSWTRYKQSATVDLHHPHSSSPPGDALVYGNKRSSADAQQGEPSGEHAPPQQDQ